MDISAGQTNHETNTITKEDVKSYIDTRKEQIISLVMRQTDYDYDIAKQKLEENNYQYMKVLEQYMELDTIREEKNEELRKQKEQQSVQQKIYGEIRGFMDEATRKFEQKRKYMEQRGYKPVMRDISSNQQHTKNEKI